MTDEGMLTEKRWLLHYPCQVAPDCEYPAGNAARLLLDWAERSSGAKPGGYLASGWNCARLARACRKFAGALAGLGIVEGERVAMLLPDCAQAFIAFYGTLLAGAVAVPLELPPADSVEAAAETRRRLAWTGAAALVVFDAHLPAATAAREGTALRVVIATSKADGSPGLPARLPSAARDGLARRRQDDIVRWSRLLRRYPDTPASAATAAPGSLAMIRYTRGRTGEPKGAMLTHANLIAGAVQTAAWRYADELAQLRCLAALPLALRAGDAGYALAEAAVPPIAQPANRLNRPGTLGLPLPDTAARIVGEDSLAPLAPGALGELALRGPQLAAGYWNRPRESAAAFRDGWLRTGDIAVMDEDGFVTLIDRKSEAIARGAHTVYPRRVEPELARHPAVAEASVVGIRRHPDSPPSVRAYIRLKEGCRMSVMQLARWGLERLPPHEAPDEYVLCAQLPSKRSLHESNLQGMNIKIN